MGTDNNKSVEKYKTLTDKLPRITKIEYLLRKYETPQIRYYSGEKVEHDKALELHIQVDTSKQDLCHHKTYVFQDYFYQ